MSVRRSALFTIMGLLLTAVLSSCVDNMADRAYQRGDYAKAAEDLQSLAEGGEGRAQYDLALLYDKGLGVPQSDEKALYWYKQAAEQGDVRAQYNLALLYLNGQGTRPDYIRSYYWLSLAMAKGDLNASRARDYVLEKMTPEQITEARRHVETYLATGQLPVFHSP